MMQFVVYLSYFLFTVVYGNSVPVCVPDFVLVDLAEDAGPTTPVTTPTCSDSDSGANGSLMFAFVSGNGGGKFAIDPVLGSITVNSALDYETTTSYVLEIQVSDGGTPSLETTFTAYLQITGVNEFSPVITSPNPVVSGILETAMADLIHTVVAADGDKGKDGTLRYSITGGDDDGRFHIDKNNGKVYIAQPLDYETTPEYALQVRVTDLSETSPRWTDTTVTVKIKNVNEYYPTCDSFVYGEIDEDSPDNRRYGVVVRFESSCTDPDVDPSRRFPFQYINLPVNDYTMFLTHPFGYYRLNQPIDPDTMKDFYIQEVGVREYGLSPRLTSTVTVAVKINGVDDNPTIWPQIIMDIDLSEDTVPGQSVIMTLVATDGDPADRPEGSLHYSLDTQTNTGQFFVADDGKIYLLHPLDRETNSAVILNVQVHTEFDPSVKVPGSVSVTIHDVNDNAPTFAQPFYFGSATEGSDYNLIPIVVVSAADPDQGSNGTVSYSITAGDPGGLFRIGNTNGEITAPLPLDYEGAQQFYELTVEAKDDGTPLQTSTVKVVVDVLPVNEFDPAVIGSLDGTVSEWDNIDTAVFNFNVNDLDDGADGEIHYTGLADLYPFSLNADTGEIKLQGLVDRETTAVHFLEVLISDKSETSVRSVTATVTITVNDENDNAPVCDPIVHAEVSVLDVAGTEVTQLNCNDVDSGANADLAYSIVSGNDNGDLTIGANGKVVLTKPTGQVDYTVEILVEDKGSPVLNTSVTLLIGVARYPPVTNLPAVLSLPENISVSTVLFEINVTSSGALDFELTSGNDNGHFVLGRSTGKLYLAISLDKETNDNYFLTVKITDIRTALESTGNITITVEDINDNPPIFGNSFYNIRIVEDIALNTEIIDLDVSDADADLINRQPSFTITSGNSEGQFAIDANGKLTVAGSLDFENITLYKLDIEANDNAPYGSLTTVTRVQIEVVNKDEFPAVFNFSSSNNSISIAEDFPLGDVVLQLNASDRDGDTILYDLLSGDNTTFQVDTTGKIYLIKLLDRETLDAYELVVRASNPSGLSSTATIGIKVTDVNDNDPQFSFSVYFASVLETAAVGTGLINLTCSDDDTGDNSNLTFSIITGNNADHFRLDNLEIVTNAALSFMTTSYYKLTIKATDQGTPSRSATAIVAVQVLRDAVPPQFLPGVDDITILENTASGTEIYDADATAAGAQEGVNGTLEYSIVSGNTQSTFAISTDTGKVFLSGPVDADNGNAVHQLTIEAASKLDTSMKDTLSLNVTVGDENDNAPVFTLTQYVGVVPDGSLLGTYVLTVTTSDQDSGINSQVTYTLSGVGSADFSINASGQLHVATTIDSSVRDRYTLAVHGTDGGTPALTSEAIIILTVQSDQNTAPTYSSASVDVVVAEDVSTGTIVSRLIGVDFDAGLNGNLVYTIASGDPSGQFAIGSTNGEVTIALTLDRETQDFYQLEIHCNDGGTPSLSATIILNINITDINDNDPTFTPASYSASTTADVKIGYQLGTVITTDPDLDLNSLVSYTITAGNTGNLFSINPNTGVLSTQSDLATAAGTHTLIIQAKDSGTSPRSSTATFTISVSDTANYTLNVLENQASGASVGSVSEPGSQTYSIVSGDVSGEFFINSVSGAITTTAPLDRELVPQYILTVHVEETANPANWYNVLVKVSVDDENDHYPVFSQPSYTVQLMEGSPVDFSVFKVPVTDNDEGVNSDIILTIVDGLSNTVFKVKDSTKELLVKAPPIYADRTYYDVQIRAQDISASPKSADTFVRVNIVENQKVISQISGVGDSLFINLECSSTDKSGLLVHTLTGDMFNFNSSNVTAVDYYTLQTTQSPFLVDKVTGELKISNDILIYEDSKYIFWVVANAVFSGGRRESRQGMVRVDTFDPTLNVIEITLSVPYSDLATEGEPELLVSKLEALMTGGRIGIWKVEDLSNGASSRRKLLAVGSTAVFIYGVQSLNADFLTDLDKTKVFMSIADLLALYQAASDGTPVVALVAGNSSVVSVLGFAPDPVIAQLIQESTNTVAIVAIVCICLFLLVLIIVLYFLLTRAGRKKTQPRRSFSKPAFDDDNADIADDNTMAKPLHFPISQSPPPPYQSRPGTAAISPKVIKGVTYDGRGVDPDTGDIFYFNSKTGQTYGISGYIHDSYRGNPSNNVPRLSTGGEKGSFDSLQTSDLLPLTRPITQDAMGEIVKTTPLVGALRLRASKTRIGSGFDKNTFNTPPGSPSFSRLKESNL